MNLTLFRRKIGRKFSTSFFGGSSWVLTTCHRTKTWSQQLISSSRISIVASSLNEIPLTGARSGWLTSVWRLKLRPAIVISVPVADEDRALVTLVPHTTSPRQSRFEVASSTSFLRAGVFDAQNLVTIPHAKLVRMLGRLSAAQLADVERRVCLWLGLPTTSPEV